MSAPAAAISNADAESDLHSSSQDSAPLSPGTVATQTSGSPTRPPSSPATSVGAQPLPVPEKFRILAGVMEHLRIVEHKDVVKWSEIGKHLRLQDPLVYEKAGVL